MIVVDASVLVTALADDGADGRAVRARLAQESLLAPHLIDIEVTSAWRRLAKAGHLSNARAKQALDDLRDLRMTRAAHLRLLPRCWELRGNLSLYDASYVALAELAQTTLITADRRIANAPGPTCQIEVVGRAPDRG